MHCCLCGRFMFSAAVTIAGLPVGPKCAKRAGLVELARKRIGAVRLVQPKKEEDCPKTMDLFEDLD